MKKVDNYNLFTTKQAVKCLKAKIKKNIEFKNSANERIEIFMCDNGEVGIAEIGNGHVAKFRKKEYKGHLWKIDFNPYRE